MLQIALGFPVVLQLADHAFHVEVFVGAEKIQFFFQEVEFLEIF